MKSLHYRLSETAQFIFNGPESDKDSLSQSETKQASEEEHSCNTTAKKLGDLAFLCEGYQNPNFHDPRDDNPNRYIPSARVNGIVGQEHVDLGSQEGDGGDGNYFDPTRGTKQTGTAD